MSIRQGLILRIGVVLLLFTQLRATAQMVIGSKMPGFDSAFGLDSV